MLQPPGDLFLEILELAGHRDGVIGGRQQTFHFIFAPRGLELLVHLPEDRLADAGPLRDLLELLELALGDFRLSPPHLHMEVRRLGLSHALELQQLFLAAPLDQVDLLHRGAELHRVELLELLCHRHGWTCGKLRGPAGSSRRNGYGALYNIMI